MNAINKPLNIVDVTYAQTKASVNTDALGMREMQQRVFEQRDAQHLLVKAPPASGKSRALMFVALDKLYNQDRKKVIVAVPERSIGASFASTALTKHGFWADWEIKDEHNLCDAGSSAGKVDAFVKFLEGPDAALVCTHATLRFAFEKLAPESFNGAVLAIDEFHHVSADTESSRLGALLRDVMNGSDVHIVAMTGSYFRGDSVPVLSPEDEAKFTPVTFNYYDQLNGYEHLRSLGIGHHFYQGRYTDAIHEVLDLDKKTIVHIPSVNSGESTKDKIEEVGRIIDAIGHVESTDPDTGIISVRREDTGAVVRVADLVDDTDQKKARRHAALPVTYRVEGARRRRYHHRAGHGEGGLRLAVRGACPDGRLPSVAHRGDPDHWARDARQPGQDACAVHEPDRRARCLAGRGQGVSEQHAQGNHGVSSYGAGARAELQLQNEEVR
ncbi:DEAD/DEAH box helicase [Microbacterium sp. IO18]|uniref:DEAD/DEAH box helicase n=1 Tax=Microbacterium sp. IO18 TaxID=3390997 RepID=UPI003B9E1594